MRKSERSSHTSEPLSDSEKRFPKTIAEEIFRAPLDRRHFLTGSAFALLGAHNLAFAEEKKKSGKPGGDAAKGKTAGSARDAKKLSQVIAEFVTDFDLKNVPPVSMDLARVVFIDTVGVMLAGSREPVSDIVCDMVKVEGSTPAVSLVGQSLRSSPQLAALANGVASHAMDYDFSYMSGQSAAPVLPAILPIAETTGASTAEILSAFIIGCEVASRIVRANPTLSSKGGWHPNNVVGTVAAASACARLLKTPKKAIPHVIGISASMACGLSVNFGTMTKPLHVGHAARNGVMAALLGGRGLTSNASALEGRTGYFSNFGRGLKVSFDPFNDLGSVYDFARLSYKMKLYPCGGLSHASIDSALALRSKVGGRLADISGIHVGVTKNAGQKLGNDYPTTAENSKFSVPYLMAYTLVHGAPMITAFTEKAIQDEKVKALAKTVSFSVDPEFADEIEETPSRVKITFSDGQTMEHKTRYVTGTKESPMSQAQLEGKFFACASRAVSDDVAGKIFAMLNAGVDQPSFRDFWPLVRRS